MTDVECVNHIITFLKSEGYEEQLDKPGTFVRPAGGLKEFYGAVRRALDAPNTDDQDVLDEIDDLLAEYAQYAK